MRNRTIMGVLIAVIAITVTLLLFQSPVQAGRQSQESMESSCQEKVKDNKMIWENLSHQFFSTL